MLGGRVYSNVFGYLQPGALTSVTSGGTGCVPRTMRYACVTIPMRYHRRGEGTTSWLCAYTLAWGAIVCVAIIDTAWFCGVANKLARRGQMDARYHGSHILTCPLELGLWPPRGFHAQVLFVIDCEDRTLQQGCMSMRVCVCECVCCVAANMLWHVLVGVNDRIFLTCSGCCILPARVAAGPRVCPSGAL